MSEQHVLTKHLGGEGKREWSNNVTCLVVKGFGLNHQAQESGLKMDRCLIKREQRK